jgi:hypothetical protein
LHIHIITLGTFMVHPGNTECIYTHIILSGFTFTVLTLRCTQEGYFSIFIICYAVVINVFLVGGVASFLIQYMIICRVSIAGIAAPTHSIARVEVLHTQ